MDRKEAEKQFAQLCKRHNIWAHKWADVRICANCGKPVFVTTHGEIESIVDYLVYTNRYIWTECKGLSDNYPTFPFADITDRQRAFLDSWTRRGEPAYLFLLMGKGKIPDRFAWWVNWLTWRKWEEHIKATEDRVSVTVDMMLGSFSMSHWQMEWRNGGWEVGPNHILYPDVLSLPPLRNV